MELDACLVSDVISWCKPDTMLLWRRAEERNERQVTQTIYKQPSGHLRTVRRRIRRAVRQDFWGHFKIKVTCLHGTITLKQWLKSAVIIQNRDFKNILCGFTSKFFLYESVSIFFFFLCKTTTMFEAQNVSSQSNFSGLCFFCLFMLWRVLVHTCFELETQAFL